MLRVNQLDACELDDNISDILQYQFLQIFTPFQSIRIHRFEPELKALVRFLIWKFSLGTDNSSFGQRMLSLAYKSEQVTFLKKGGLFFAFVIAEWLVDRCDWLVSKFPNLTSLQHLLDHSRIVLKTLSLFNFTVFLIRGCYPTLKERLLGLTIAPTTPQTLRDISHSYLSREILWHGFSEFLFFVMPQLNLFSLWNWARRMCSIRTHHDCRLCAFCESPPTLPHLSQCGHTYCYYCLKANLKADANFPCCACNELVEICTPASEAI